ncbi:MAG: replicative DNA helicase [Parachlamydiales bacterium]|jgi:replicative DNA helicase
MAEKKGVKVPPASKEAEMLVLGSMLTSEDSLNAAADLIEETDFYYKEHRLVFRALKETFQKDRPADIHIIAEILKRDGLLEEVGSVGYLTSLAQYAGTSTYVEEYAKTVKDKALLRRMISTSEGVIKAAFNDGSEAENVLDEAQANFFQISQSLNKDSFVNLKDLLSGVKNTSNIPYLKELQEKQEEYIKKGPSAVQITGMPTHFIDLDKILNGLDNSNLIILASRPAMGKTSLATNLAENICFKNNVPVGFFSLEMTADQLLHRIICSQAEVESEKIKTGALNGHEYQRIVAAVNMMMEKTMVIDDQPGLKITDLRARARRLKESHNIGFLVIDYLQLISGSGNNRSIENRQNEISEISRMLKNLARELNIPVLCLAQLSRKVEERTGHRPQMSDLRESGSIEQDSDQVMFLLRREYYDPYDKPGQAELIIAKNRHGQVGSVNLTFRKEIAQFANYSLVETSKETTQAFAEYSPQ